MKLENKVAVITGGTSGIGLETARLFAREGAKVVIAGSTAEKGETALAELLELGAQASFFRADVSDASAVEALFCFTKERYGRLDYLICDAGASMGTVSTLELDEAVFQHVLDVNAKGTYLCAKYAVPLMRRTAGCGAIVNISSLAAHRPKACKAGYVASKAAVAQMSKALALEFAPEIRVNCVTPGLIDTGMISKLPAQERERLIKSFPAKRPGRADEVAKAILFLACDDSSYIYGAELCVDGGDGI